MTYGSISISHNNEESYYNDQAVGQPLPASKFSEYDLKQLGFTLFQVIKPDASDLDMSDAEFKCWKRTYKPLKKISKHTLLIEIASYKHESLGFVLYDEKKHGKR